MSEGQITSAESYFITGRAYVTGAHAIVKSPVRQRYANDFRFVFPCMSLMAHAIEVYLKAWLSVHGYNDETLRKRFRHDLRSLYNEARTTGLQEPHTREGETIHDLVESFEAQHEPPYPLRYPFDGWQIPLPKLNIVFQIFVRLDRIIADTLGKAVPADLDWRVTPDEELTLVLTRTRRMSAMGRKRTFTARRMRALLGRWRSFTLRATLAPIVDPCY